MQLCNALKCLEQNPDLLCQPSNNGKPYSLYIKYNTNIDVFEWVNSLGESIEGCDNYKGHKRVLLSSKLLDTDCKLFILKHILELVAE